MSGTGPSTAGQMARAKIFRSQGGDAFDAHVWAQDLGDQNRAVGLLIILHDSNPSAADGEPGTVQGMNEVALSSGLWLETNSARFLLARTAKPFKRVEQEEISRNSLLEG